MTDSELYSDDYNAGDKKNGSTRKTKKEKLSVRMKRWFVPLWRGFAAGVLKCWNPIWKQLRKFISVPFLVTLFLSFAMWYAIKLSYTYKTEIPVSVNVDGHEFEINCIVEGQGTRLFARRYYNGEGMELNWSDLDVSPSAINPGWVVISPYSLQNAISARNTDIKIISVGPIPEIEL